MIGCSTYTQLMSTSHMCRRAWGPHYLYTPRGWLLQVRAEISKQQEVPGSPRACGAPSLWTNTALQGALPPGLVPWGHLHPQTERKNMWTRGQNSHLVSYLAVHWTREATSQGTHDNGDAHSQSHTWTAVPRTPPWEAMPAGGLLVSVGHKPRKRSAVYTYQSF